LGLLACSLAICELIIHLQLACGSMLFTAVMLSTTFADVNKILVGHCNPMVYLMADYGLHYFETVELFPHRLEPDMSMESAGILTNSHIWFKISLPGGSPLHDSMY